MKDKKSKLVDQAAQDKQIRPVKEVTLDELFKQLDSFPDDGFNLSILQHLPYNQLPFYR